MKRIVVIVIGYVTFLMLLRSLSTNNLNITSTDRIAVVGNGPSVMSRARGAYIDDHDVVIRFNTSHIIPNFTGVKTSIHVKTAGSNAPLKLGAQRVTVYNHPLLKLRPVMCKNCVHIDTRTTLIRNASSGLVILSYLCQHFPKNEINIIGFDGLKNTKNVHYYKPTDATILDRTFMNIGTAYHSDESREFERLLEQNPIMKVMR